MSSWGAAAGLLVGAYLLGSVPFGYLIVWTREGRDIRRLGSGNPGATNVLRIAGLGPALAVLGLDIAKGVAPVAAARALDLPSAATGGAAFAAVLGHVFPLFLGFRGGKGVATAGGAMGALVPAALAAALAVFAATVAWKRFVSLGSIAGAAMFPLAVLVAQRLGWAPPGPWMPAWAAAIALLVIARHSGNIRRLRRGTERRLGERVEGRGPA